MSADEIYQRLQGLKLFGMAALCDELLGHRRRQLPKQWLRRMIGAEESERQCRSIRYQMGIAKFPLARDLDSFDTQDSPVSPELLRALDRDDFLAQKRNLLLIGGTDTGKPIWPSPWGATPCAGASGCVSMAWSIWSTNWSRRKRPAKPDNWPTGWSMWMR